MCALLGDPNDRPNEFTVGSAEFDPECLGYASDDDAKMPDGVTDAATFEVEGSLLLGGKGHEERVQHQDLEVKREPPDEGGSQAELPSGLGANPDAHQMLAQGLTEPMLEHRKVEDVEAH